MAHERVGEVRHVPTLNGTAGPPSEAEMASSSLVGLDREHRKLKERILL